MLEALARQFGRGGTEALESDNLFRTDQLRKSGGVAALRADGRKPAELIMELKRRLLVADREWLL